MNNITIRTTTSSDEDEIKSLYSAAFPEEDLISLVLTLLNANKDVFCLVAEAESKIIGHTALTICDIKEQSCIAALLGPLAVLPDVQNQGVGSLLVKEGIMLMEEEKIAKVLVLGNPNYYGKFGFAKEECVMPPYQIPQEWNNAWQSCNLNEKGRLAKGVIAVPKMWRRKELWSA